MGSRLVLELRPQWSNAWRALQRTKAIELDRLSAARKLRQPVTEYSEVRAAFDSITYAKGETLLAMFEQWLGEEKFREGVRRYVAKYAWGNATADDFFASLAATDDAVIPAFRGFADRSGVPLLDVALDCSGKPSLVVSQQRFVPAGGAPAGDERWVFPACFDYGDATKGRQACTLVRDAKQTVPLPVAACPQWVVANRSGIGYYLPRLSPSLYAALPKADRVLAASDYDSMLGDLDLLARGGAVGYQVTLPTVARLAASPDARVAIRAYAIVDKVPAGLIDSANAPRYAAWIRHHFGDRARALGLLPRKGEPPEVVRLRKVAVPAVAVRGQDTALARKAQQLAARWLTHRSAIPPESRGMVLAVAARTSETDSAKLFDALLVIASGSTDANEREDVAKALAAFREPALLARALPLTLAGGAKARFSMSLLESALEDDVNRAPTLAWIATNIEPLSANLPSEQQGFLATFANDACTARERVLFVGAFEAHLAKVEGGVRRYKQALEKIDSCLALRRAQQAPLNAFLASAK
jgi:alanyl aminopeptidase